MGDNAYPTVTQAMIFAINGVSFSFNAIKMAGISDFNFFARCFMFID